MKSANMQARFISGGIFERNENVKPIMAKLGQNMVPFCQNP